MGVGDREQRVVDAVLAGAAEQIAGDVVGLDAAAGFQVAQHRGVRRARLAAEHRTHLRQEALGGRISGGARDLDRVLQQPPQHRPALRRAAQNLAHIGAHQAGGRRHRAQHDQLLPHLAHDVGHRRRLHAGGGGEGVPQRLAAAAHRPVLLAEDELAVVVEVAHDAVRGQRGADLRHPAEHRAAAEALAQRLHVRDAVEHRQHRAVGVQPRLDRRHRGIQVVGLAGEQHEIVLAPHRLGAHAWYLDPRVAVTAFDAQAIARELRLPRRAHQEGDVRPGLHQPAAEIPAERAGAEDQDAHQDAAACVVFTADRHVSDPIRPWSSVGT